MISKKFAEIKVPATIKEAVEVGHPMVLVEKIAGKETLLLAIEIELAKAAAMLNIDARLNLQNNQVPIIAQELYETFKTESIEDFMLCFKRGVMGLYDNMLLRLDGAVVTSWMRKYLEEKYSVVEAKVLERKTEEKENKVDYAAYTKRMAELQERQGKIKDELLQKEKDRQLKDLKYEERRKGYTPPLVDAVRKRELHFQWIKENIDPITMKHKEGYLSEEEWLKSKGESFR